MLGGVLKNRLLDASGEFWDEDCISMHGVMKA